MPEKRSMMQGTIIRNTTNDAILGNSSSALRICIKTHHREIYKFLWTKKVANPINTLKPLNKYMHPWISPICQWLKRKPTVQQWRH